MVRDAEADEKAKLLKRIEEMAKRVDYMTGQIAGLQAYMAALPGAREVSDRPVYQEAEGYFPDTTVSGQYLYQKKTLAAGAKSIISKIKNSAREHGKKQ